METETETGGDEEEMMDFGYYNVDCMEGMRQFPDKYFDLAIVDPPYGIGVGSMGYTNGVQIVGKALAKRRDYTGHSEWDKAIPDKSYFDELFRVSKHQIIWGGNYFTEHLKPTKSWIVWDKRCEEKYSDNFADCELAWASKGVARVFRFLYKGMLQQDMKNKADRFHPTQKPVQLYKWLLDKYMPVGGGTTRHARRISLISNCLRRYGVQVCRFRDRQGILRQRR